MEEDTGKQYNNNTDIPTPALTKGVMRTWLGTARDTPTVSPAWLHCGEHTSFMEAHTIGVNEFQTLLPVHLHKKGHRIYSPANGTIITRAINTPGLLNLSTKYMLSLVESTIVGSAAGTTNTGRALVMYQMQLPTIKSKIIPLSDTLEIKYEGMYYLPVPEGTTPVDITITMTWVYNAEKSRVLKRYQNHPYLRITIAYDIKAQTNDSPEFIIWHDANRKLLQFQLMGPVRQAYGMDRNPVPYLSSFLQRAEDFLRDVRRGTEEETSRRVHNFLLETLLGRRGTTTNQWIGIPIAWLQDAVHRRTLQATARAVLPASTHHNGRHTPMAALPAPPTPANAVARMPPSSHTSPARARLDHTNPYLLVDTELNDIESQRREYESLQEDANKKPAAKPTAMKRNKAYLPPPVDGRLTPKLPTDKWLILHKATISPTGVVQAIIPVPDEVQEEVRDRINFTSYIATLFEPFTQPPQVATAEDIRRTVEEWLEWNPVRFTDGRLLSLYPNITVPQYIQNWMNTAQVANPTEASTDPTPANVEATPLPAGAMNQSTEQGHTADSSIVIASDSDSE